MFFDKSHPYLKAIVWNNNIPSLIDDHITNELCMSYVKLNTDRHDFVFINFACYDGTVHDAFYYMPYHENVPTGEYVFAGWDKEGAKNILTDRFEEVEDVPTNISLLRKLSRLFASYN